MKKYEIYKITTEDHYDQIREFLKDSWRVSEEKTLNWHPARLDYFRWHVFKNCFEKDIFDHIYICSSGKEIAGVIISDSRGGYQIQVHPEHSFEAIYKSSLEFLEEMVVSELDIKRLRIPVPDGNAEYETVMKEYGFTPTKWLEVRREAVIADISLVTELPEGYKLRSLGNEDELPARSWASWRAFHPGEPDDKYEGWEWYFNIMKCPLYRKDLDLVCEAPDSTIAGFCTVWFDEVNCTGLFEPVGVVPEHWRKGVGRAMINEGYRRLKELGARFAYVDSYEEPAHTLYERSGLKTVKAMRTWEKHFTKTE